MSLSFDRSDTAILGHFILTAPAPTNYPKISSTVSADVTRSVLSLARSPKKNPLDRAVALINREHTTSSTKLKFYEAILYFRHARYRAHLPIMNFHVRYTCYVYKFDLISSYRRSYRSLLLFAYSIIRRRRIFYG